MHISFFFYKLYFSYKQEKKQQQITSDTFTAEPAQIPSKLGNRFLKLEKGFVYSNLLVTEHSYLQNPLFF